MSKTYTAKVRVKGNWFQDEVETECLGDVAHILSKKYGVDPQQDISNISEKRGGGSSSGGFEIGDTGAIGGAAIIAGAIIFLPWVLAGGAGFAAYKVAKGRVTSAALAGIVAASGVGGFIGGKAIHGDFNSPTPAPAVVEEVKPSTYVDQTGETVADNQQNFYIVDGKKVWY